MSEKKYLVADTNGVLVRDMSLDDSISRQAAIEEIFNEPLYKSGMKERTAVEVVLAIYEKIKSLPSAQPEQCYGYSIKNLIAFGIACRRAGVEDGDLKQFATNCEFAWKTMQDEFLDAINKGLNEAKMEMKKP